MNDWFEGTTRICNLILILYLLLYAEQSREVIRRAGREKIKSVYIGGSLAFKMVLPAKHTSTTNHLVWLGWVIRPFFATSIILVGCCCYVAVLIRGQ